MTEGTGQWEIPLKYSEQEIEDHENAQKWSDKLGENVEVPARLANWYEFSGSIDDGSTGDVFRAIDRKTGKQVAVKVARGTYETSETTNQTMLGNEVRSMGKMLHPNILPVVDAFQSTGNDGAYEMMITEIPQDFNSTENEPKASKILQTLVLDDGDAKRDRREGKEAEPVITRNAIDTLVKQGSEANINTKFNRERI